MVFTLVYDADCGPCTRFRNAVEFLDAGRRIRYRGLAEADAEGLLEGVAVGRRHRSFHLVSGDGETWSGAGALAPLASLLPGGRPMAFLISSSPIVSRCAAFIYGTFSRLHDAGSCSYGRTAARRAGDIDVDINLDATKRVPDGGPRREPGSGDGAAGCRRATPLGTSAASPVAS